MRLRLALLLAALPCLGVTCGPAGAPPPPDECTTPDQATLTSLEIGPHEDTFRAWAAEDQGIVAEGGQGGSMIGVRMRVGGAGACLAQHTRITLGASTIAEASVPVNTYEDEGGARTTRTLWVVFDGPVPQVGQTIDVVTEAGGLSAETRLTIVD